MKKNGVLSIGGDLCVISGDSPKHIPDDILDGERIVKVGAAFIGASGDSSVPLVLRHYFMKKEKPPEFSSVDAIFDELLKMHQALKFQYFMKPDRNDDDAFETLAFSTLIASPHGIFGTYRMRCVQEYARFCAIGFGSNYALGALEVLYNGTDDAEALVKKALDIAAEFESEIGRPGKIYSLKTI